MTVPNGFVTAAAAAAAAAVVVVAVFVIAVVVYTLFQIVWVSLVLTYYTVTIAKSKE